MTGDPRVSGYRRAVDADVPALAALHASGLPGGFLTSLGPRFLRRLYRALVRSRRSFVLVATPDADDDVAGFVAATDDTGLFYRHFLARWGVIAALEAAPAVVRAPRHVLETIRYGVTEPEPDLPPAEILAVSVDERHRGEGIGTRLLDAAMHEFRARDVDAVRVVTAVDNDAAVRMYERNGFVRRGQVEVHSGFSQQVLVWR